MKKIIGVAAFAVLGIIALSSCKKDYTCLCTIGTVSDSTIYKDIKKKDAEAACSALNTNLAILGGSCALQ